MRFLTAYLSKIGGVWEITGSERMKNRPIGILVDALKSLGANIEYLEKEGFPPLKITGKALKGGSLDISGNVSSQFISAILMIAPTMMEGLKLHLTGDIMSMPYIKMTLGMMKEFSVKSKWVDNTIIIKPQEYKEIPYFVESDWSAASYWYEIVSLIPGAKVMLVGLKKESLQGDSRIAEFFSHIGVNTEFINTGVIISNNGEKMPEYLELDLGCQPDLAQTLVVTCCLKQIKFKFTGLQTLRIKETDRITALEVELKKLGYVITDHNDSVMIWDGAMCDKEQNPVIKTYEDHRMAMAFAPASIIEGKILIDEPQVVSKSYPGYWEDLDKAGFIINVEEK